MPEGESWAVFLTERAEQDLASLPAREQARIPTRLLALQRGARASTVRLHLRKLHGSAETWRLRVGDYRVLFAPDWTARVLVVTRIAHRRDAYR